MHDVFECIDNIFDVLNIEGSTRPTIFSSLEDAVAALDAHMGSFAAVWSVSCETHVCTKCARTTRTYTPCLYVSRVSDTSTISDARCEGCGEVRPRTVRWELARPGETVFVRINRHTSAGAKRHDRVCLNEGVTLGDRVYSMRAMVYHDGITLDGGHYTCAFKSIVNHAWILNSDIHVRFAGSSFNVSETDAHKTYGATYSM
jgi:ubiquitin C-terminal hydrolase